MNEKQLEILEKVLVNSANVTMATLIFGTTLSSRGFDLIMFFLGCIIFVVFVGGAIWLRKK